jgi:hypothetical protein
MWVVNELIGKVMGIDSGDVFGDVLREEELEDLIGDTRKEESDGKLCPSWVFLCAFPNQEKFSPFHASPSRSVLSGL